MPEPTIREQVEIALSDAVLDNAIYQSCPAPLCALSILRDELLAALAPILEPMEHTDTRLPAVSAAREQRMKATETAMRAEYDRLKTQKDAIREQVETILREARVLRFGAPGRSPLAPVEVYDLMAALSPLLERVERDHVSLSAMREMFESELRRRVEALSDETADRIYMDILLLRVDVNHDEDASAAVVLDRLAAATGTAFRGQLLTALLAPPATPETERE
jgi:hypothetical protein